MIRPPKESLRYCILLISLLTTGAVAVGVTINFLDNAVPSSTDRMILTSAIWTLTLGFMLIAGAFGLWTVHFATEAESLRRISLLVDRLNDVRDAILATDRQAKVIGMNATAESFFGKVRGMELPSFCPVITENDLELFLDTDSIMEREYQFSQKDGQIRTLRFRIQPPVSGISLFLISDITSVAAARTRQRRAATLHLAAHMAQGIANDFNDLLCGISGHASLLLKPNAANVNLHNSATAIQQCADRGIWLARQLNQLSQADQIDTGSIALDVSRNVANGVELLTSSLDPSWVLDQQLVPNIPPVNIPPSQIEHITHSLGLIVAETAQGLSGTLHITLRLPEPSERILNQNRIAGVLEIARFIETPSTTTTIDSQHPENGVISSLVQTLIVQAGGMFEAIPDGRKAQRFRIFLPEVDAETFALHNDTEATLAIGLEAYTAGWHVLLCMAADCNPRVPRYFEQKNIRTIVARNEDAFLQALAQENAFEVIFIQPDLLGQHFDAFLPIVSRISPDAAIVLLQDHRPSQTPEHVITLPPANPPSQWIHAMVDARSRKKIPAPTAGGHNERTA